MNVRQPPPTSLPDSAPLPAALADGYRSFMRARYAPERQRYQDLADRGQNPDTLVIACCDSRAAPEIIFDTRPGEIFVMRNVANLVPPYKPDGEYHATSAALEYAVQALKVKHIVVMGHGRCGASRRRSIPRPSRSRRAISSAAGWGCSRLPPKLSGPIAG
jgi:carbonic anhydrase